MTDSSKMNLSNFEDWLKQIESSIEYFLSSLPPNTNSQLDFSPDSLKIIEAWLLQRYSTPESTFDEPDKRLFGGVLAYIGETNRKNLGGYWNVHFAALEPDYKYGENPVVEGFYKNLTVCPYFNALDAIEFHYESNTYLSSSLKGLIGFIDRHKF